MKKLIVAIVLILIVCLAGCVSKEKSEKSFEDSLVYKGGYDVWTDRKPTKYATAFTIKTQYAPKKMVQYYHELLNKNGFERITEHPIIDINRGWDRFYDSSRNDGNTYKMFQKIEYWKDDQKLFFIIYIYETNLGPSGLTDDFSKPDTDLCKVTINITDINETLYKKWKPGELEEFKKEMERQEKEILTAN